MKTNRPWMAHSLYGLLTLTLVACSGDPEPAPAAPEAAPAAAEPAPAEEKAAEAEPKEEDPQGPVILGGLDQAEVVKLVQIEKLVKECKVGAKGEGSMRIIVAKDGKVAEVSHSSPEEGNTPALTCIGDKIKAISFPSLSKGEKAIVRYPVQFD